MKYFYYTDSWNNFVSPAFIQFMEKLEIDVIFCYITLLNKTQAMKLVIEWYLFNAKWAKFQLYHDENKICD
jgi:hypothetical protein